MAVVKVWKTIVVTVSYEVSHLDLLTAWMLIDLSYHMSDVEHNVYILSGDMNLAPSLQAAGLSVLLPNQLKSKDVRSTLENPYIVVIGGSFPFIRINNRMVDRSLLRKLYSAVADHIFRQVPFRKPEKGLIGVFSKDATLHQYNRGLMGAIYKPQRTIVTNMHIPDAYKLGLGAQNIQCISNTPLDILRALFHVDILVCPTMNSIKLVKIGAALEIPTIALRPSDVNDPGVFGYQDRSESEVALIVDEIEKCPESLIDRLYDARVAAGQQGMRNVINEFKEAIRQSINNEA